jgi:hypothetical protein
VRDESVSWVAGLTEIMEPHREAAPGYAAGAWREAFGRTPLFSRLRHAEFRHVHRLEREAVVARVGSVSFVAALSERDRAGVLTDVRALLARDSATRGREVVELPYCTDVWWCAAR